MLTGTSMARTYVVFAAAFCLVVGLFVATKTTFGNIASPGSRRRSAVPQPAGASIGMGPPERNFLKSKSPLKDLLVGLESPSYTMHPSSISFANGGCSLQIGRTVALGDRYNQSTSAVRMSLESVSTGEGGAKGNSGTGLSLWRHRPFNEAAFLLSKARKFSFVLRNKLPSWDYWRQQTHEGKLFHNQISGDEVLHWKLRMTEALRKYGRDNNARASIDGVDVFDLDSFMPKVWFLGIEQECQDWQQATDPNPLGGVKWVTKPGDSRTHNAKGVSFWATKEGVLSIANDFHAGKDLQSNGKDLGSGARNEISQADSKDSAICSKFKTDLPQAIVQQVVQHPLLVQGKLCDLRVYVLVANVQPAVVLWHDGFVRVGKAEVGNKEATLRERFITTFKLGMQSNHRRLTLERLETITGMKGIAETVRSGVQSAVYHVFEAGKQELKQELGEFSLYGFDFFILESGKVLFNEVSFSPQLALFDDPLLQKLSPKLVLQHLEIIRLVKSAVHCGNQPVLCRGNQPVDSISGWRIVENELCNKSDTDSS